MTSTKYYFYDQIEKDGLKQSTFFTFELCAQCE